MSCGGVKRQLIFNFVGTKKTASVGEAVSVSIRLTERGNSIPCYVMDLFENPSNLQVNTSSPLRS